ncbi:glycine cleavage system aminomethyltransferase GcvT [Paractinoplanes lichenicola]|uniref:Aminomethyltransferase n=1 Tax=Paractinoplanes lichenicola TaxID=2802976 RepID=A0ABS1VPM2_9ACTN|nr:glycine cleavage system aminomethyltransferase GcvT [Actinoplanes lichenicola]MBL7256446.1 glycine cleavage system aminomethyltransferase GcvT [Actinoplanes lichenicola]
MSADALSHSPLHERHVALGAKFAAFGGWEMPLEYAGGGVIKEHTAVREASGVFDVSHLGKARVRGEGAAAFVNACLTNDLGRIAPGKAQYTLCCDETGGVVDDLIAYLISDDEVFLIPNAANTASVVRLLQAAAPSGITVTDEHRSYAVLAVQGPQSPEVLAKLGLPTPGDYMAFVPSGELIVCRTGYTGEHGYELVVPWSAATGVWDSLIDAGVRPCGLGARDTLRTEMGYPLHGQDLTLEITPVQARSGWAVGWGKPSFWGRDALVAEKAEGPRRTLRGLELTGRGIPRGHMPVYAGGSPIGETTSGTFSPTKKVGIALALLDTAAGITDGDLVEIDIRGRRTEARVVKPPFVQPSVR